VGDVFTDGFRKQVSYILARVGSEGLGFVPGGLIDFQADPDYFHECGVAGQARDRKPARFQTVRAATDSRQITSGLLRDTVVHGCAVEATDASFIRN